MHPSGPEIWLRVVRKKRAGLWYYYFYYALARPHHEGEWTQFTNVSDEFAEGSECNVGLFASYV